ncbi:Histone-lysine N-methyltransferase ASHR1 [Mycena venus]|uniref:Histone-lysine N-methyltransferase ASHR1 n=1 Tax=Mycena venus TaxID=2733690 RepID=A0A8H6XZ65_9AGAR|nr:Histone-lysine N-methyltransferase ASHR1 [Mycena venus]
MSFANLKAARQAKQSYVTPSTLESSRESSAVSPEPVTQPAERTVTETIYKSIPEYLEIRTSSTSGRGLWTTKACNPGQVIFAVKPHAAALSNERLDLHCSQCFGEGNNTSLKRCTKCQVIYYCDSTCQNVDWPLHKNECAALQRITTSGETSIPSDAIRCLGRIMWKRQKQGPTSAWTREIDLLQSHNKDIEPSAYELHTHLAVSLVRYLGLSSPSEIASFGMASGADLANFVSRFVTNTFTITDPSLTPLGASVSPPVALINHSCDPNAVVVFPRSRPNAQEPLMQVVALRDIAPDEEILTAYIDTTLPKAMRQASLRETYLFSCTCTLCASAPDVVDPRESVSCPKSPIHPPTSIILTMMFQKTLSRAAPPAVPHYKKTDEVLDALRIGQQALDKATLLQFSDPAKARQLTSKLIPILTSAGLTPPSHPLLALTRLHTALLIADLPQPQSQSPITPTEAQASLDEAVVAATKAVAGLDALGRLLAVDEPAPRAPGSAAEDALRYPPSGAKRLRLALETLVHARAELSVGFGAANEGGVVGRGLREDIVRLERELGMWKKGVGEALRDAREAKVGRSS